MNAVGYNLGERNECGFVQLDEFAVRVVYAEGNRPEATVDETGNGEDDPKLQQQIEALEGMMRADVERCWRAVQENTRGLTGRDEI